jgi:hypothetical protein
VAAADIPIFCGMPGISNIQVSNAISTSIYTWRTVGGNIVGDTVGPSIVVDQPGMYIVSQQLMDSCGFTYAMDTVLVTLDPGCTVLSTSIKDFRAQLKNNSVLLGWTVTNNAATAYYESERSLNNRDFCRCQ